MNIRNLSGVFTGSGFRKKHGRRPTMDDAGFVPGPVDIQIKDGVIESVRASEKSSVSGASFDGTGLFATAAWSDSHTHSLFSGERAKEYFLRWQGASYVEIAAQGGGIHNTNAATIGAPDLQLLRELESRLSDMRKSGSTTVEVKTGYAPDAAGELRLLNLLKSFRESDAGRRSSRIFTTFLPLHALPKGAIEKEFVEAMTALLPKVAEQKLAQAVDAFPDKGFFSLDESLRFAMVAQANGFGLKIHADEITPVGATEAFGGLGALSVDHLQKVSARGLEVLGRSNTVATLLPATSFFLGIEYAPARRIIDSGARIALATDFNPGTAPVQDFRFTQLLAASQMKLSPAEILSASTHGGAAALGLEAKQGTLEARQTADILLWQPTHAKDSASWLAELFSGMSRPEAVFQEGRRV